MPWTRRIRARVSRLALDTEPPTMPGVFLDRGAYRAGQRRPDAQSHTYEVMDLALRCGAQLLARGAAAVDVESAVHAAATTLGLDQIEVDVTYNALWISAVQDGTPVATSRVVRQGTPDYQRVSAVHQLLTDIVHGDADVHQAQHRLALLESAPRTHGSRVTLVANGVLSGSVAVSLGSGWAVAAAAAVAGLLIIGIGNRITAPRVPPFFIAGLGGAIAVTIAALLTAAQVDVRPSLVVAAGIVVLLPGVALVGAVRDALVGFPLTGIGRAMDGTMVVLGIVAGVLVALAVATAADVDMQIIPAEQVQPTPLLLRVAAAAMAAASAAVVYQAPWPIVGASLGVGALGFAAATLLGQAISATTLAFGAAAVIVGMAAGVAAQRARTLALVFVVPGILPLLPGLTLYRGSLLLSDGQTVEGIVVLLEAGVRMMALASGALLGELLVSRRRRG